MKDFFKKYGYHLVLGLVFIIGFLLRIKALAANPSMWHDECSLAWSVLHKSYLDYFSLLNFGQVAPPLFMMSAKFFTQILGTADWALRFAPFVFGCFGVVAFYFAAKQSFKTKFALIFALFMFAINGALIYYSAEFKQYSSDVFFGLVAFLAVMNLEKPSLKKAWGLGVLIAVLIWASMTSSFVILAGFLNLLITQLRNREFKQSFKTNLALVLPLVISGLFYVGYLFKTYTGTTMSIYWGDKFITLSNFVQLFVDYISFIFAPIKPILFAIILFCWGFVLLFKEKSKVFNVILLTFGIFILVSAMKVYPFAGRLGLFLAPFVLILIVKPLDYINLKKASSYLIFVLIIGTFIGQALLLHHFIYAKNMNKREFPREMMAYMIEKIGPEDVIFVNNPSNNEFEYYSSFYKIKNEIVRENPVTNKSMDENYRCTNLLSQIKPKRKYWLFLPYDYPHKPVVPCIIDWAAKNSVIYEATHMEKSLLMYVYVK